MAPKIIDGSIESALEGSRIVRAPVVNMKVRKSGKPARRQDVVRQSAPPEVGAEVVRVINECDPVGFLSDIINGKAIECFVVEEDGKVTATHETASLNQRIAAAKFLAERYMPKVAVVKHAHLHKSADNHQVEQTDGRRSFAQIVTHAAHKSSDTGN